MPDKRFYITTPIYYANDIPHIGHAYTTILSDVLTRYHKLLGYETFFLTGTDEHGQKVEQAAAKREVSPQTHVDQYHLRFKELWEILEIDYSKFIRTTDSYHKTHVQNCLQELHDSGDIYIKEYEGWYSVGEERFFADGELVDGKDPISGRDVEWIKEKNYFFRMGRFQEKLIEHIKENPDYIVPDFRKNEVLGFLKQPLQDLCISRPISRLSWGIPLPFDNDYVTYVWFDALLNYESGVLNQTFKSGETIWPADYHIIGKDILTTHAVYWSTMLMALGHKLPRHILAHGWWLSREGKKQSKSSGNAVNPLDFIADFGVDSVRYFLIREMTLGQDANFSEDAFITRINSELANDLGNAVNRVNKFILSRFNGKLPRPAELTEPEEELRKLCEECRTNAVDLIQQIKPSLVLDEIFRLIRGVNKYLELRAPWKLAKENSPKEEVESAGTALYTAGEALRTALVLLYPVMPKKCMEGLKMLGAEDREPVHADLTWGVLKGGETIPSNDALFPRHRT